MSRLSCQNPSLLKWDNMKNPRRLYFKTIVSVKKVHWSDFQSSATPHSIWRAKRLPFGCPPQCIPDLLEANNPSQLAERLLAHVLPQRPPSPPLLSLSHYEDYTTLTVEEMSSVLARSSNNYALDPNHIPYFVRKGLHLTKPSLLRSLLDPPLVYSFHPSSLKTAIGIILEKPKKLSDDSPSSCRVKGSNIF